MSLFRLALEKITPDEFSTEEWVAFDLDSTTSFYDGWKGPEHIGEPIPAIIEMIKQFLAAGVPVKFLTARVATHDEEELALVRGVIDAYSLKHIGQTLPATCIKDRLMVRLYDDRARQILENKGIIVKSNSPV